MRWLKLAPVKGADTTTVQTPERQRAFDLIAAIDAGGIPLLPARVNDIARKLGLEVSVHDKPEHTIARIRAALRV
ncbi:MAG: hypothetical protein Q8K45_12795 [Rubrivivax sp.]|nr:hypothetical protein [Rubrivivax sp.]